MMNDVTICCAVPIHLSCLHAHVKQPLINACMCLKRELRSRLRASVDALTETDRASGWVPGRGFGDHGEIRDDPTRSTPPTMVQVVSYWKDFFYSDDYFAPIGANRSQLPCLYVDFFPVLSSGMIHFDSFATCCSKELTLIRLFVK
jgi:hypothetical protein